MTRWCLTVVLALTAALCDAGALVALRPAATVSGDVVTLGDVADVRGTDPVEAARLAGVLLGPSPAAGREIRFDFAVVRSRLAAAGADLSTLEFSGAAGVSVKAAATAAAETKLPSAPKSPRADPAGTVRRAEAAAAAAVSRHLTAKAASLGGCSVVAKVRDEDAASLAAAQARGFAVAGGAAPWTGPQSFTLRYFDEAERVREASVACVVSRKPTYPVAKSAVPRGHVLQAADLEWRQSDAVPGAAADPRQLIGHEATQTLRAGLPIPADAVRAVPLVRAGQFVTVTSRKPGIAVQRVMKAQGDGAAGDVVPMVTLEDRKTILARVTGLLEADVAEDAAGDGGGKRLERVEPSRDILERRPLVEQAATLGGRANETRAVVPLPTTAEAGQDGPRALVNSSVPLSVPPF